MRKMQQMAANGIISPITLAQYGYPQTMAGMQQGIVWPHGMMAAPALINGTMLNHMPSAMMPQVLVNRPGHL